TSTLPTRSSISALSALPKAESSRTDLSTKSAVPEIAVDAVIVTTADCPSATVVGPDNVTEAAVGVPEPNTHPLKPVELLARTRTRYGVPFDKLGIACDAVVPVRVTATQPADAAPVVTAALLVTELAAADV
ncbi:MAG: hypothetical protein OXB92_10925, partial [Acidimicrobiaceae bacterium]|nr:hypothetical protein [Acidimicrobiaceae bacterium]